MAESSVNVRGINRLLTLFPESDGLIASMERVDLPVWKPVFNPHEPISNVYFPLHGVISLVVDMDDGRATEVATVGNEGMAGIPVILGAARSPLRAFVQVEGEALCMPATEFAKHIAESPALGQVVNAYVQAYLNLISQSAACNRMHAMEQRLCRWILMTHDRVGLDRLHLTQEFIAEMLGVRRPSVSVAASALQHAGFIQYHRGMITVIDRAGIEAACCECYRVVRDEFERLLR